MRLFSTFLKTPTRTNSFQNNNLTLNKRSKENTQHHRGWGKPLIHHKILNSSTFTIVHALTSTHLWVNKYILFSNENKETKPLTKNLLLAFPWKGKAWWTWLFSLSWNNGVIPQSRKHLHFFKILKTRERKGVKCRKT